MDDSEIRRIIHQNVDNQRPGLEKLGIQIHENPELGWEEENASRWVSHYLEKGGFRIERGICELPTAFRASYGRGKPVVAFLAEYDALPEIGHGCGHNIIAGAAAGAGLAARSIADQVGGTIIVMGCPAEELLGGKVIMVERRAFDGIDVALMVHPVAGGDNWAGFNSTASVSLEVEFWGKESHAAADPWDGINALEALMLAFNNINAFRQHIRERGRINGIITDGGKAPNLIPEHSAAAFIIRAHTDPYLEELRGRVVNCFEGATRATGARLDYRNGLKCAAMQSNLTLLELWRKNLEILGLKVGKIVDNSASTDMGNVSITLPSIHAFLSISPDPIPFHTREFAAAAASVLGKRAVLNGAKALAMTAADVITQSEILSHIKQEFMAMLD